MPRLDWEGCGGLRTEMEDSLATDGIIMIVKGDENLSSLAEMLGGSVPREEEVPDKEHEVHEGPELDRLAVAGALRVFAGPESEAEAAGDQVGNVVGYGGGGGRCLGNYGVHDSQGDCLFSSDRGIFEPVGLELPREALVDPGVCLGVRRFSRVGQSYSPRYIHPLHRAPPSLRPPHLVRQVL